MPLTSGDETSRRISAIQVLGSDTGSKHMGLLTQITLDPGVDVCGPGFNDKTVQVNFGGAMYFVFREDLETQSKQTGESRSSAA